MSGHGESVSIVTPDKQRIPRNNKRKKTTDTLITGKESIREIENPKKRAKQDIITDVETLSNQIKDPFKYKEYNIGDTNEKTRGSDNSSIETDVCARNLGK